ncbi:MAG TPA: hypothetical protein VK826_00720 [Bacteroidia bacterium]|nr:hypothetical protein [Bacteroidia bacterium]
MKMNKTFTNALLIVLMLLMLVGLQLSAQVNLSNGLVAYYPLNGKALDYSGNGNNGIPGSAAPTTDQWGNAVSAYNFNGTSGWDEITIPMQPANWFTRRTFPEKRKW